MMQFMDNVKLEGRSTIGILDPTRVNQASHTVNLRKDSEMYKDPTCVNQASHTINLRKDSEMYKDMTMKEFNKEVYRMTKDVRVWVSLYIAKTIQVFMQEGKKPSRFCTFLSKFHLSFQFCIEI
jgi:hypothetical protein